MIIIRMTGGLGNQMFQYALAMKLRSMGKEVKFDDTSEYEGKANARPIMLWCFGIDYPRATREEINAITDGFMRPQDRIRRKLFGRKSKEYAEKDCNFDPEVLQHDPAYLTGYFQSERYFADIADRVKETFSFSERVLTKLKGTQLSAYLQEIESSESVSVHMRRGDYVTDSAIYGGNCTDAYYEKAIAMVRKAHPQARFFFFSNDISYVKEWLSKHYPEEISTASVRGEAVSVQSNIPGTASAKKGTVFTVVEGTTEETGYFDLLLMSRCKHQIVANSSFSWWGAYLDSYADKMVIAPANWFNNQVCRDIYTKDMIRVDANGKI